MATLKNPSVVFLEDLLTRAKDVYYGSDKGENMVVTARERKMCETILGKHLDSINNMTDKLFDKLEDKLRELAPNSKVLKQIGAPLKYGKDKVAMAYPMPSLDKVKPDTGAVEQWAKKNKGPYLVMDKEDGVGVQVIYNKKGKPIQMFKAFDNELGIDVSHLIPVINGVLEGCPFRALRCELVMQEITFSNKWSKAVLGEKDGYENARNLVSGIVNKTNGIHPAAMNVDMVVLSVLEGDLSLNPDYALKTLTTNGFNVVPNRVVNSIDDASLSATLKKRKSMTHYAIDGLVVVTNEPHELTNGNPSWGRAFKETTEDDIVSAKVVAVHWNKSKHGYAKPRVEIEPVRLAGVTVTFATGFNGKFIEENSIGPGAVVRLTRSGDVIPHIIEVTKAAKKPQMPEYAYHWTKGRVDIIADDTEDDPDVAVKRIASFFSTIGTEGLDQGMVARAYDAGFTTFDAIIEMTTDDWFSVQQVKMRSATKLVNAVQAAISNAYLPTVADATGFFGRGFGTKYMEKVVEIFDDLPRLYKQYEENDEDLLVLIETIHGMGSIRAKQFVEGLPLFCDWLSDGGGQYFMFVEHQQTEVVGKAFEDAVVTFTNFRSPEWTDIVEQQGGTISDFKKTTTLLVYPDGKTSNKVDAMVARGGEVMTKSEFTKHLKKKGLL